MPILFFSSFMLADQMYFDTIKIYICYQLDSEMILYSAAILSDGLGQNRSNVGESLKIVGVEGL